MDTLSKMESSMCRKELCEADLEGTGELDCSRSNEVYPSPFMYPLN